MVSLNKNEPEPRLPNTVCEAPLPNAAPMVAPLPCCTSTKAMMQTAMNTCIKKINWYITWVPQHKSSKNSPRTVMHRQLNHHQYRAWPKVMQRYLASCCRRRVYALCWLYQYDFAK